MANYSEKSRTAYNKKANGYDNSREGQFTNRIHQLLLPMIDWQPGQSVLDVACGTGSLLAAMNDRKQIRGFGIDISERMIEQAMARNPGMAFYISGCDRIPCPNDSMDIITVCAAYHHFPDVAAFAGESARLLKPGGLIYIVDIFVPSFLSRFTPTKVEIMPFTSVLLPKPSYS